MSEFYTQEYTSHFNSALVDRDEALNGYVQPDLLHPAFYRARYDTGELIEGKWDALLSRNLVEMDGRQGDCVFEVMIHQFGKETKHGVPLRDTADQIREKSGLPPNGGVTLSTLKMIVDNYSWMGTETMQECKDPQGAICCLRSSLQLTPVASSSRRWAN